MRATKRGVATLLLRVLSLYAFVKAVEFLSDKFIYFFNPENYDYRRFIQIIGPPALLFMGGVAIWYLSPMIASRTLKSSEESEEYGFSLNEAYDLVFSGIGLFLIVNVIPDIVYGIGYYYNIVSQARVDKYLAYISAVAYLGSLVIKLVLGVWLLIGSHGIVKAVRAMRRD